VEGRFWRGQQPNTHVKPMTDMDHWAVVDRWNYPDDGYGDCEDYVLLKRRSLIQPIINGSGLQLKPPIAI
jgi:predicted transglutaminase-like cysteine proteinase